MIILKSIYDLRQVIKQVLDKKNHILRPIQSHTEYTQFFFQKSVKPIQRSYVTQQHYGLYIRSK